MNPIKSAGDWEGPTPPDFGGSRRVLYCPPEEHRTLFLWRKSEGLSPPAGNIVLETRTIFSQGRSMDSEARRQRERLLRSAVLAGDENRLADIV